MVDAFGVYVTRDYWNLRSNPLSPVRTTGDLEWDAGRNPETGVITGGRIVIRMSPMQSVSRPWGNRRRWNRKSRRLFDEDGELPTGQNARKRACSHPAPAPKMVRLHHSVVTDSQG